MFHKIYSIYSDIKNKEEINDAMLRKSITEHEEANKVNKELEDSRDNNYNNQTILKKRSPLLISMVSNHVQLRYGTAMKLGLISTEDGAS